MLHSIVAQALKPSLKRLGGRSRRTDTNDFERFCTLSRGRFWTVIDVVLEETPPCRIERHCLFDCKDHSMGGNLSRKKGQGQTAPAI